MLSKQFRLKKNKEFNYIFNRGTRKYSKVLNVVYVKTKLKYPRIGFSISNKVGNSVVRHRVKRKISEIVRLNFDCLNPNYNYVFVAREGSEKLDYHQLEQDFLLLIQKVDIS